MGNIPTNGYGVNSNGLGFSLNWLGPNQYNSGGLSKVLLGRHLLATSISYYNSIDIIQKTGICTGFNLNIFDLNARIVVVMEK